MNSILLLFLSLTSIFFINAQQVTLYVNPTGQDFSSCGNVTNPCASLGYTLTRYLNGTVPILIRLAPGVYTGNSNVQITLGSNPAPNLTIAADPGVVTFNFTFTNSGWSINSFPANLVIQGIVFTGMSGKGLSFQGSSPQPVTYDLFNCKFDDNFYSNLSISEGVDVSVGNNINMIIEKCSFTNNWKSDEALNWSYGPLILHAGVVQVEDCLFVNNTCRHGPLTILNSDDGLPPLDVVVNNCTFTGNYGLESASVYSRRIRNTRRVDLSNLQIYNNQGIIGIIVLSEGIQNLTNSRIINNQLSSATGAVVVEALNNPNSVIYINNCLISQNSSPQGTSPFGSGLVCDGIRIDTTGTTFSENRVGNLTSADTQFSCNNCPGCPNGGGDSPVKNDDNYLWLLFLLIIPFALVFYGIYHKRAVREDYKAIRE